MTKADDRKRRVVEYYDFAKQQDPFKPRDSVAKSYSFKTGIAVRTILEYHEILRSIGAIDSIWTEIEVIASDGKPYSRYKWKNVFDDEALN